MKKLLLLLVLFATVADAQTKLQIRRGTTATLPTGIAGEPLFVTDSVDFWIGSDSGNVLIGGRSVLYGKALYAPDGGSTDAYAITLVPAPTKYWNGMTVRFTANTANTGAATINVNSLGAKSIRKSRAVADTLATGDIAASRLVEITYVDSVFIIALTVAADTSAQQIISVWPQAENFITTSSAWMPTAYDVVYAPFTLANEMRPDSATYYASGTLSVGDSILVGIYSVSSTTATRVAYSGWTDMGTTAPKRLAAGLTTGTLTPGQYILAYSHNTATAPTLMCGFYDGSTYTAFIKSLFGGGGGVRYLGQVAYAGLAEMPATIDLSTAAAYTSTPGPPIFYLIEN